MQNTVTQRLIHARRHLGLSLRDFAKPLDISHSAVSDWEKGKGLSKIHTAAIEQYHNISSNWLLTGEGEMMVKGRPALVSKETPLARDDERGDLIDIPILTARPCAGTGNTLDDYVGVVGTMSFDVRWLRMAFRVPPENLRLMGVDGDSMMPTFLPDELIFVDASPFQDFQRLGVWVLSLDGLLYVKRILRLKNEYLASSDNSLYPPIPLDETTRLMGRVVGGHKRFF